MRDNAVWNADLEWGRKIIVDIESPLAAESPLWAVAYSSDPVLDLVLHEDQSVVSPGPEEVPLCWGLDHFHFRFSHQGSCRQGGAK